MSKLTIQTKRAYDEARDDDGLRVLVDRMWPRGVKKEEADVDRWLKEVAPSKALRQWFGHDPDKWAEFKKRYFDELREQKDALHALLDEADERGRVLTLVYSAKDEQHNNAVALAEYLRRLKA